MLFIIPFFLSFFFPSFSPLFSFFFLSFFLFSLFFFFGGDGPQPPLNDAPGLRIIEFADEGCYTSIIREMNCRKMGVLKTEKLSLQTQEAIRQLYVEMYCRKMGVLKTDKLEKLKKASYCSLQLLDSYIVCGTMKSIYIPT